MPIYTQAMQDLERFIAEAGGGGGGLGKFFGPEYHIPCSMAASFRLYRSLSFSWPFSVTPFRAYICMHFPWRMQSIRFGAHPSISRA
ncbi:hypothetical protein EYC84_011888 [Monilinia fructicola]|uniref:Uncharacterized protein n=1 Tax=Monilinia fructicola TaxID=38448 RepID=A0A5M9J6N3_MONFR|nr:hypothetical protein EYC84_011888 [Monilinia fructicola]